jgi:predicted hydrolase (HD superfamily)
MKTSGAWSDCFTTSTTRCFPRRSASVYRLNILCGRGYSDRIIRAILGHATYTACRAIQTWPARSFATDELCGFLVACALVRPSRSLDDMEVSSVKKKLKDKAFARSVNRDDIKQGVEELGVNIDEHIRFVIDALRPVQKEIG